MSDKDEDKLEQEAAAAAEAAEAEAKEAEKAETAEKEQTEEKPKSTKKTKKKTAKKKKATKKEEPKQDDVSVAAPSHLSGPSQREVEELYEGPESEMSERRLRRKTKPAGW